jgi:hypothetical protein
MSNIKLAAIPTGSVSVNSTNHRMKIFLEESVLSMFRLFLSSFSL